MAKNLNRFLVLPAYILDGIVYKLSGFLFTPRPRFVCFPVTFQCNSRCQMCHVWQNSDTTEEIELATIEEVFSNGLFKKVEEVVFHGGEPTLRDDIKEIYRIVTTACPHVRRITLSTNGQDPELVSKRVQEILSVVDPHGVNLVFTVSIDGLEESHEKIRRIKGGFSRVVETIEVLKKYQEAYPIEIKIITVIQPQNVKDLEKMEEFAREKDVEITFQPLMFDTFYGNSSSDPRLRFSDSQCREYRQFVSGRFTRAKNTTSLYWKNFIEMMNGGNRAIPCAYDRYVLSLYPTGEVLPCSRESWIHFGNVHEKSVDEIWFGEDAKKIRKRMKKEVCPRCNFYCGVEFALRKEFFTYCTYYVKSRLSSLLHAFRSSQRARPSPKIHI